MYVYIYVYWSATCTYVLYSATTIVDSMTTLMEAGLFDGEEATTIQSDYINASCVVTSSAEPMSFETGERERPTPLKYV